MSSRSAITYHLRKDGQLAHCGAVALWPNRAVVSSDLFSVQVKRYQSKVCNTCKAAFQSTHGRKP